MDDLDLHRGALLRTAYRYLGSMSDAEDVVQEAYLRWVQHAPRNVDSPEAWLRTVVSRLSIDRLRRRSREREQYPGPWLPEPVANEASGPEHRAEIASDLSIAFLAMLERLTVSERVAFLMREAFGYEYGELARVLDKSEDACRHLVHRAKAALRRERPKRHVDPAFHERTLHRLLAAMQDADERTMLSILAPNVTWTADAGGKVPQAAARVVVGAERIVRLGTAIWRKGAPGLSWHPIELVGEPAAAWMYGGKLASVFAIDTDGERVTAIYAILNPDKLEHVRAATHEQTAPRPMA